MASGQKGMAPVGDGTQPMAVSTPAALPETSKPRQMPSGGAPAGGMDMGMGGTADANVPQQPQSSPSQTMAKVREIRREIVASNPQMLPQAAHRLAMQVVALQHLAVIPSGPLPAAGAGQSSGGGSQSRVQPAIPGRHDYSSGFFGDLNDPRNTYSPLHPNHPLYRDYAAGMGQQPARPGRPGDNHWAEQARRNGYAGEYPTLRGGVEQAVGWGLNKLVDRWHSRGGRPDSSPVLSPGGQSVDAVSPGTEPNGAGSRDFGAKGVPAPPPVRQRVIPSPADSAATQQQVQQTVKQPGAPVVQQSVTDAAAPPQPKRPSPAHARPKGGQHRRTSAMVYLQAGEHLPFAEVAS